MNYHLNGPILKLIINNGRRNKKQKTLKELLVYPMSQV